GSRMQGGAVWQGVDLAMPFSIRPVIVSQTQTVQDAKLVQTRQRPVADNARAFSLMLEETEAQQRAGSRHGEERVGWLALDAAGQNWGDLPIAVTTAAVSSVVVTVPFPVVFAAPPALIGGLATFSGSDPASLRYQALSAADVSLRVAEDTTADSETGHAPETVSILAFGVPAGATATLFGSRIEWLSPGKRGPAQQPMALQGPAERR
ncbi:MAG: hypothetical protein U1E43_08740, partial [Rhodospirillales bacterium]